MIVRLICSIVALFHLVFLAGCSSPDILSDIKADRIDVEIDEKTAISRAKLSSPKLSFRWVETEAGEGLIEGMSDVVALDLAWKINENILNGDLSEANRTWFQRKTIASIIVGVIAVGLVVFVLRKRGGV